MVRSRLHAVYDKAYRNANVLPSGKRLAPSGKDCGFASALRISDATHCLALQAADAAVGCVFQRLGVRPEAHS